MSTRTSARRPRAAAFTGGSLRRGLRVLDVLVDATSLRSAAEIARACELEPSTAFRLLTALIEAGYVLKDRESKRYFASPKALIALPLYHPLNVFRRDAERMLQGLRDELGETIGLVVYMLGERALLDLAQGRESWGPYYQTWLTSPLHGSASGKLLLMTLSREQRARLLGRGPYEAHTPHTLTDPAALEAELERSRMRGYVVARDDAYVGLTALGAPVLMVGGGLVAGLVLAGRTADFPKERVAQTGLALKRAADVFANNTPSVKPVGRMIGAQASRGLG
jgi:DNA-binding IclR family transcriptional regulator